MRVLITGSTGLLAKGFEETAPQGAKIAGVHRRDYRIRDTKASHEILDVTDAEAVDALFARNEYGAVIHAAGLAAVDHVERHPEEGRVSNVDGTRNIARAAKRHGAYMVYISTNAVFDGDNPPYAEDARTRPLHAYGRLKLECEGVVAEEGPEHCVARPILMYGWNHAVNRPNPVTWIYEKLLKGEALSLVNDVFENPLYNHQCGRALWAILEKRPSGIFHLAGADTVSRHEMGLQVAEVFELDPSEIKAVESSHFPSIAPRPKNTTFATDRMQKELGVAPMTFREGLAAMRHAMGVGL